MSGSWIWEKLHHQFTWLVFINAGTTLLVLLIVPLLPKVLAQGREGQVPAT